MKTLQTTLLTLLTIIGFSQEIRFEQVPNYQPNSQFIANFDHKEDVEFADIDGDGDIDALSASRSGIVIYQNIDNKKIKESDDSTFMYLERYESIAYAIWKSTLTVFDVDNDGDQDFLIGLYGQHLNGNIRVSYNDGQGNFSSLQILSNLNLSSQSEIYNADIDNDGDQDFAISSIKIDPISFDFENIYDIYSNDGNGNFTKIDDNIPSLSYGELDFFDVDNDNDLDAIVVGNGNGNIESAKLYINNNNTFSEKTLHSLAVYFVLPTMQI